MDQRSKNPLRPPTPLLVPSSFVSPCMLGHAKPHLGSCEALAKGDKHLALQIAVGISRDKGALCCPSTMTC